MSYYKTYRQRKFNDYLLDIQVNNIIEEKQILRIKHLLNSSKYKEEYLEVYLNNAEFFENMCITYEQEEKGINYLKKKYLTKNNKIRKNCYLSQSFKLSLAHSLFKGFEFMGFIKLTNDFDIIYEPLYSIIFEGTYGLYSFSYFHFMGYDFENDLQLYNFNKIWHVKGNKLCIH